MGLESELGLGAVYVASGEKTPFYCATIAYHVGLNAISGGRRTPANDQEKWTFGFDRVRVLT